MGESEQDEQPCMTGLSNGARITEVGSGDHVWDVLDPSGTVTGKAKLSRTRLAFKNT